MINLTLNFEDVKQYQAFVDAVARAILCNFQFSDELERNIADELIDHHRETLAETLLDKLLERVANQSHTAIRQIVREELDKSLKESLDEVKHDIEEIREDPFGFFAFTRSQKKEVEKQ